MSINLDALTDQPRLLIEVKLKPAQGSRFQPTGFPDLGAATFRGFDGNGEPVDCLLVESAQSMANRLEQVCWDEGKGDLLDVLRGLPYVRSTLPDGQTTDSIREAHRLNSPYIVNSDEFSAIESEIGFEANKPFDRRKLAAALLKYDPSSLLHGTFLEKVGGVVRLPRAVSGFIEAAGVERADSGGVKVDRVQPGTSGDSTPYGKAAEGYGNVPYHRTEFSAKSVTAYFNLDLAQLRGYGLGSDAETMLVTLALFKIRELLYSGLRLRTSCDFDIEEIEVTRPKRFEFPSREELHEALPGFITTCGKSFTDPPVTDVNYSKGRRKKESK
ncbi:MAG: type I-U CRISPR-associated RAMP protein Csb1/Cas7u [Candidatus Paceibacterota bacterium]